MKFLVTLLMCLASSTGFAQWQWATSTKGVLSTAYEMATDPSGNILVTGSFGDTAILGSYIVQKKDNGSNYDIFLAKLNSQGNFIWARRVGPNSTTYTNNVVCDKWGNIYVTGAYSGWGNPDSVGLIPLTTPGVYIAKYDPNGTFIWMKEIPASNQFHEQKRLAVDTFGNLYYAGSFKDSFTVNNIELFSKGYYDAFLLKLDTNGDFVWARSFGGGSDDGAANIAVDANADIYLAGYFRDTCYFAGDTIISVGAVHGFIAKYDRDGTPLFARHIPTYGQVFPIAVDAAGSVYVAGKFGIPFTLDGSTITPVSTENIFLARYNSSGVIDWLKVAASSKQPMALSAIETRNSKVFVAGRFRDSATIGTDKLYSTVPTNIFLMKYHNSGNPLWTKTIKSSEYFYTILHSLATDAYGTLYAGGTFAGHCFFDNIHIQADSNEVIKAFVAKLHAFTSVDAVKQDGNTITAYPNPSDGSITLDLNGDDYNRVEVFNMMGVRMFKQSIVNKTQKLELDLSHLPSGSYYLKALGNHRQSDVVKILLTL